MVQRLIDTQDFDFDTDLEVVQDSLPLTSQYACFGIESTEQDAEELSITETMISTSSDSFSMFFTESVVHNASAGLALDGGLATTAPTAVNGQNDITILDIDPGT